MFKQVKKYENSSINISNKSIKEKAYVSLVRPTLEYASSVWDPYQQNDIHRLEMVQRRAARYVTNLYHNTSSVSSMIEQLEWTTLQEWRKHSRLLMIYKLKNNIVRVDASSKLMPNERPSRNNNEQALRIPSCKTTVRKDLFYPKTIKEWNTLPNCTVCPESWILQGSAPSLNLNDTVFTCTVYKFHFIASKYVRQVFMRTPKKWQNSQPVDGGH